MRKSGSWLPLREREENANKEGYAEGLGWGDVLFLNLDRRYIVAHFTYCFHRTDVLLLCIHFTINNTSYGKCILL